MTSANFFVATIRNGQFDEHRYNDALSSVYFDQKTTYYAFNDLVSEEEFKSFIAEAWDVEFDDIELTVWEPGVFRVKL